MKKILDVPYYSQNEDIKKEKWRKVGCGIPCVKMVIDYFYKNTNQTLPTINHLLEEGIFINGFKDNHWSHISLASMLRNYGLHTYNQEFRSHNIDVDGKKSSVGEHEDRLINGGIEKIVESLEKENPVIVSVYRYFETKKGGHLVVVTGFEKDDEGKVEGFYYHEPNSNGSKEDSKNVYMDISKFKEIWRKFAIFTYSKD